MQWLYLLSSCFPSNGAETGRLVVVSVPGVRMTMNVQVPGLWECVGTHPWINRACKPTARLLCSQLYSLSL